MSTCGTFDSYRQPFRSVPFGIFRILYINSHRFCSSRLLHIVTKCTCKVIFSTELCWSLFILFYLFAICFTSCVWCACFFPCPFSLSLSQIDVCARSHRLIMIIVCFWMSGAILQSYEVHTSQWKKERPNKNNNKFYSEKKSKWNKEKAVMWMWTTTLSLFVTCKSRFCRYLL